MSAECLCIFTRRRHLKKTSERPLQYARWLTTWKPEEPIYYTCLNPFTTLASYALIPQRSGRDYNKETGISCQHSPARHSNRAKPEEAFLLWRHDNTANAPFSFSGDVRFQDSDGVDLSKLGDRFLPSSVFLFLILSFNVCCHHVHA